jgi:23S rRNA (adenine2503-C2)-methyltransferase
MNPPLPILKNILVPTGNILVLQGEKGKLEALSIGDYGADVNLKADFLGLNREPGQVRHTQLLPLEKKWVVTISTQYGCPSRCVNCDVPKVGYNGNATYRDMIGQIRSCMSIHPEVERTERLNVHFARMGEPTWNFDVFMVADWLSGLTDFHAHPVVSTMMPHANDGLQEFLGHWMYFKNHVFGGNAGLQLSINSTDDDVREQIFGGSAMDLGDIADMMDAYKPVGRKFTLNFALHPDWPIDPQVLLEHFDPAHWLCKLTPLHITRAVANKNLAPTYDQTEYTPYAETEAKLKAAGFDVIVFLASKEEDESGITCGNAVLSTKE